MDNYEIKMLRQEIESLQAQLVQLKETQSKDRADAAKAFNELDDNCFRHISDLRAAQNNDRTQAIAMIAELRQAAFQYIADIHDMMWPVVHKMFPGFAATKKQLNDIIKRGTQGANGKEKP